MDAATTVVTPRRLGLPLRALGDEHLVRLAAAGDHDALAAIFERHHQALYRYCRALLGSAEDAEDALQSAMARVVRALPGEIRELALKPWLYRIAHNEAMRIAGRRRPQGSLEEAEEVAARPDAEDRESRERLGELVADMRELSERQRGALVLRELEGASFAHIASVFGGSEASAKQTVYEARVCLADFARGRAMECDEVTHALSDGDRRRLRGRPVRAHLRACEECSAFAEALRLRPRELRALAPPLAAPAAAALLAKLLGGGGGGAAGGLGASSAAGGTLASLSLPSFALKGLATVAVVTSVAAGAGQLPSGLPGAPSPTPALESAARPDGDAVRRDGFFTTGNETEGRRARGDEAGTSAGRAGEESDQDGGNAPGDASADATTQGEGRSPAAERSPEGDLPARVPAGPGERGGSRVPPGGARPATPTGDRRGPPASTPGPIGVRPGSSAPAGSRPAPPNRRERGRPPGTSAPDNGRSATLSRLADDPTPARSGTDAGRGFGSRP